jgi:phosphonopyruvate decarboxylase
MGRVTTGQLDLLEIPWLRFPDQPAAVGPALARVEAHLNATGRPFALVMSKGMVAPHPLTGGPRPKQPGPMTLPAAARAELSRAEALRVIQDTLPDLPMIATTGYTGRELYALGDRPNQFYMVGSMGCASSLGLGLALAKPDRRVLVIDGDGALLMRMGALATIGAEAPPNLIHLVLDNGQHESTGGQATVSGAIDFCALAAACGYPSIERAIGSQALALALRQSGRGPRFIHVPIKPGVLEPLPRPTVSPEEVARRFQDFLDHGG